MSRAINITLRKIGKQKIIESFFANTYPKFRMNMDLEGIDSIKLIERFNHKDFIREFVSYINTKLWDIATLNDICLSTGDFKEMTDKLIDLYNDEIISKRTGHSIMFEIMRNCMIEGKINVMDEKTKSANNINLPYYTFDFSNIKSFNIEDNLFIMSELGRFAKEMM